MSLEEIKELVGKLGNSGNLSDLDRARSVLFDNLGKFGKEQDEKFMQEAARLQTIIFERLEQENGSMFENMDLTGFETSSPA